MSIQQHITPAPPVASVESYGHHKHDAVLTSGRRVIERVAFPTRREAFQFLRLIERAGICRHTPSDTGATS